MNKMLMLLMLAKGGLGNIDPMMLMAMGGGGGGLAKTMILAPMLGIDPMKAMLLKKL